MLMKLTPCRCVVCCPVILNLGDSEIFQCDLDIKGTFYAVPYRKNASQLPQAIFVPRKLCFSNNSS